MLKFKVSSHNEIIIINLYLGCNCTTNGTINDQKSCDQITGQCKCKDTVFGTKCSSCKSGYFNFPQNNNSECELCHCNLGGSIGMSCDQINGKKACFMV